MHNCMKNLSNVKQTSKYYIGNILRSKFGVSLFHLGECTTTKTILLDTPCFQVLDVFIKNCQVTCKFDEKCQK